MIYEVLLSVFFLDGDIIKKFFKDIYNKGNFKDYLNRNKIFIIVSICLVILSFFNGKGNIVSNSLITYLTNMTSLNYSLSSSLINNIYVIFVQNIVYSLFTILMGLSFSVFAILLVVKNVANTVGLFNISSLLNLILNIFVLVGSFLVTKIEVRFIGSLRKFSWSNLFSRIKVPLKDLILTLTIVIIVVIIRALIESFLFIL